MFFSKQIYFFVRFIKEKNVIVAKDSNRNNHTSIYHYS